MCTKEVDQWLIISLVNIDNIDTCISCVVLPPMEAFNIFCPLDLAGSQGALSDHSILKLEIDTGFCQVISNDESF